MVKLASGDRVRLSIDTEKALLQVIGRNDSQRIEEDGYGWNDGDTVVMAGSDVALFLHRLSKDNADGTVIWNNVPTSSRLNVKTERDIPRGVHRIVLVTDSNSITLEEHERDMLVSAIKSQVWRLFT